MPKVIFHHADAADDVLDVADGTSVMRAAVNEGVAGIVGECGGQAMCATCHVYVRDEFIDCLPAMSEDEDEMLDETVAPRDPKRSRLGCQIHLGGEIQCVEVDIPARQA